MLGVCSYGYVPLSHLRNIVMGIQTTTLSYSENRDHSVQFDHTLFLIMSPHQRGVGG